MTSQSSCLIFYPHKTPQAHYSLHFLTRGKDLSKLTFTANEKQIFSTISRKNLTIPNQGSKSLVLSRIPECAKGHEGSAGLISQFNLKTNEDREDFKL
jgi:hypothetical protein